MKRPPKGEKTITKSGPHRRKSRRCVAVELEGGAVARVLSDTGQISDRTKEALQAIATGLKSRTHRCARMGCLEQIPIDRVACKTHWYELPEELRARFRPDMGALDRGMLFRECRHILQTPPQERSGCSGEGCACVHFDAAEDPETGETLTSCECGHAEEEHA